MLVYHPAFDANHCGYRLLALLHRSEGEIPIQVLKLLDFYYLFPGLLKRIKPWPSELKQYRKVVSSVPEPYENVASLSRTYFELSAIQDAAIAHLVGKGLLLESAMREGVASLVDEAVPAPLIAQIEADSFVQQPVFQVLSKGLTTVNWHGKAGLKARSGLMEYRYDA